MMNKAVLDNLSSLTSGVDLNQIPPIHQKRLLTFVNHFIITTVGFLNHFARTCESKLLACDEKMQKLEAVLCILEAKLNSIPGLEDITAKSALTPSPVGEHTSGPAADKPLEESSPATSTSVPSIAADDHDQPSDVTLADSDVGSSPPPAVKDPELARFLKMVQFGVPVPAVKLKMQQEGFSPDLLDS